MSGWVGGGGYRRCLSGDIINKCLQVRTTWGSCILAGPDRQKWVVAESGEGHGGEGIESRVGMKGRSTCELEVGNSLETK
jgi:hypothetical protein